MKTQSKPNAVNKTKIWNKLRDRKRKKEKSTEVQNESIENISGHV